MKKSQNFNLKTIPDKDLDPIFVEKLSPIINFSNLGKSKKYFAPRYTMSTVGSNYTCFRPIWTLSTSKAGASAKWNRELQRIIRDTIYYLVTSPVRPKILQNQVKNLPFIKANSSEVQDHIIENLKKDDGYYDDLIRFFYATEIIKPHPCGSADIIFPAAVQNVSTFLIKKYFTIDTLL